MRYFAKITPAKTILWCYLIWYLFFATRYFDPTPRLWLTSLGLSGIIGIALLISTWSEHAKLASWTTFRLFLMPFCVSSFAALVKGRDFILVFSPRWQESLSALGLCAAFCGFVAMVKVVSRK